MIYYKTVIDDKTYYLTEYSFCAYSSNLKQYVLCNFRDAQDAIINEKIYRVDWLQRETGPDAGTHPTIRLLEVSEEEYEKWEKEHQEELIKRTREIG